MREYSTILVHVQYTTCNLNLHNLKQKFVFKDNSNIQKYVCKAASLSHLVKCFGEIRYCHPNEGCWFLQAVTK